MKARVTLIILFIIFMGTAASAQVRVTGHVSAEVVEAASLQNNMNSFIGLNGTEKIIELGKIQVTGAENTSYEVKVNQTNIYNQNNNYRLETQSGLAANGITLSALMDNRLREGEYNGNITVIVSYN